MPTARKKIPLTGFSAKSIPRYIISSITIIAFLFSTVLFEAAWAFGTPSMPPGRGVDIFDSPGLSQGMNADSFTLPAYLGIINERYEAPDADKMIIHVQDAHCNYACQKTIAQIISYVNEEYGVRMINLEGGVGEYDLSLFGEIPDSGLKERVSDLFMREGFVNGAEYFAINNPETVELWGVEDERLYKENLASYRASLEHANEIEMHLKALSHIIENLKRSIYDRDMMNFDTKYSKYKANNLDFRDYLEFLLGTSARRGMDIKALSNVYLLNQMFELEKQIDFQAANSQRNELMENLKERLSKNALKELTLKTAAFGAKKIAQKDFYSFLLKKASSRGIELSDFPELQSYIVYVSIYGTIDSTHIMREIAELEDMLREDLCKSEEEIQLSLLSKHMALLRNLFSIRLTKDDYTYYRDNEDSFLMSSFMSFIEMHAPRHGISVRLSKDIENMDRYREELVRFYSESFERDRAFLDNMKLEMPEKEGNDGIEAAIMVTGGFHAENLAELFTKRGISYVSVMPKFMNSEEQENPYFRILSGNGSGVIDSLSTALSAMQVASLWNSLGVSVDGPRNAELARIALLSVAHAEANEGRFAVRTTEGDFLVLRKQNGRYVFSREQQADSQLAVKSHVEASNLGKITEMIHRLVRGADKADHHELAVAAEPDEAVAGEVESTLETVRNVPGEWLFKSGQRKFFESNWTMHNIYQNYFIPALTISLLAFGVYSSLNIFGSSLWLAESVAAGVLGTAALVLSGMILSQDMLSRIIVRVSRNVYSRRGYTDSDVKERLEQIKDDLSQISKEDPVLKEVLESVDGIAVNDDYMEMLYGGKAIDPESGKRYVVLTPEVIMFFPKIATYRLIRSSFGHYYSAQCDRMLQDYPLEYRARIEKLHRELWRGYGAKVGRKYLSLYRMLGFYVGIASTGDIRRSKKYARKVMASDLRNNPIKYFMDPDYRSFREVQREAYQRWVRIFAPSEEVFIEIGPITKDLADTLYREGRYVELGELLSGQRYLSTEIKERIGLGYEWVVGEDGLPLEVYKNIARNYREVERISSEIERFKTENPDIFYDSIDDGTGRAETLRGHYSRIGRLAEPTVDDEATLIKIGNFVSSYEELYSSEWGLSGIYDQVKREGREFSEELSRIRGEEKATGELVQLFSFGLDGTLKSLFPEAGDSFPAKDLISVAMEIFNGISDSFSETGELSELSEKQKKQLGLIFFHAVPNAVDAVFERIEKGEITAEEAKIDFSVFQNALDGSLVVGLSDNGIGISRETLQVWRRGEFITNKARSRQLLGRAGVGVMEILSTSAELSFISKQDDQAYVFTRDSEGMRLEPASREEKGTDILVSLSELDVFTGEEPSSYPSMVHNMVHASWSKLPGETIFMHWREGRVITDRSIRRIREEIISENNGEPAVTLFGKNIYLDQDLIRALDMPVSALEAFFESEISEQIRRSPPFTDDIVITLLQESGHLFEDNLANGFIGVNKRLFTSGLSDGAVKELFTLGLLHEFRHEALEKEKTILNEKLGLELSELDKMEKEDIISLIGDNNLQELVEEAMEIEDLRSLDLAPEDIQLLRGILDKELPVEVVQDTLPGTGDILRQMEGIESLDLAPSVSSAQAAVDQELLPLIRSGEDREQLVGVMRGLLYRETVSDLLESIETVSSKAERAELKLALRAAAGTEGLGEVDPMFLNVVAQVAPVGYRSGADRSNRTVTRALDRKYNGVSAMSVVREGDIDGKMSLAGFEELIASVLRAMETCPGAMGLFNVPHDPNQRRLFNMAAENKGIIEDATDPDHIIYQDNIRVQYIDAGAQPDLFMNFVLGVMLLDHDRKAEYDPDAEPSPGLLRMISAMIEGVRIGDEMIRDPRQILGNLFRGGVLTIRRIDWESVQDQFRAWEAVAHSL